jgi:hypothetical protein
MERAQLQCRRHQIIQRPLRKDTALLGSWSAARLRCRRAAGLTATTQLPMAARGAGTGWTRGAKRMGPMLMLLQDEEVVREQQKTCGGH